MIVIKKSKELINEEIIQLKSIIFDQCTKLDDVKENFNQHILNTEREREKYESLCMDYEGNSMILKEQLDFKDSLLEGSNVKYTDMSSRYNDLLNEFDSVTLEQASMSAEDCDPPEKLVLRLQKENNGADDTPIDNHIISRNDIVLEENNDQLIDSDIERCVNKATSYDSEMETGRKKECDEFYDIFQNLFQDSEEYRKYKLPPLSLLMSPLFKQSVDLFHGNDDSIDVEASSNGNKMISDILNELKIESIQESTVDVSNDPAVNIDSNVGGNPSIADHNENDNTDVHRMADSPLNIKADLDENDNTDGNRVADSPLNIKADHDENDNTDVNRVADSPLNLKVKDIDSTLYVPAHEKIKLLMQQYLLLELLNKQKLADLTAINDLHTLQSMTVNLESDLTTQRNQDMIHVSTDNKSTQCDDSDSDDDSDDDYSSDDGDKFPQDHDGSMAFIEAVRKEFKYVKSPSLYNHNVSAQVLQSIAIRNCFYRI